MASWLVFEPPQTRPTSVRAADKTLFIRDGFSVPALIFGPFWLLWQRLWLVFAFWLAATIMFFVAAGYVPMIADIRAIASSLFGWWLALEGPMLRAWILGLKGWRHVGLVRGENLAEAEIRFFHGRAVTPPPLSPKAAPPPSPPVAPARMGPWGMRESSADVLGVFPEPQGRAP